MIDLVDAGYHFNISEVRPFINYVNNGGSILTTHDQLDQPYLYKSIPEISSVFGLDYIRENYQNITEEVFINLEEKNHSIFNNVYILNKSKSLKIVNTHRQISIFTKGIFLMQNVY